MKLTTDPTMQKKKISELEDKAKQKGCNELWSNSEQPNIHVTGITEGNDKPKTEKTFQEIMTKVCFQMLLRFFFNH